MMTSSRLHIIDLLIKTAPDDTMSDLVLKEISCAIPVSILRPGAIVWSKSNECPMTVAEISRFATPNHDGHDRILTLIRTGKQQIRYFCNRKELVNLYRI